MKRELLCCLGYLIVCKGKSLFKKTDANGSDLWIIESTRMFANFGEGLLYTPGWAVGSMG